MTFASILLIFIGIAAGILGLVLLISLMVSAGRGIGFIIGHLVEYVVGTIRDAARAVGAVVAAVFLSIFAILNVIIGRWSAANHYADGVKREAGMVGRGLYGVVVRRPLKLLFLDGVLEGVEVRAVEDIRDAPGADKPARGIDFPGFEITGSLPAGGSGAKLYIARPDEKMRGSLPGRPDAVVIKSFALSEGSSLPQIVRESRSLDSAKRLGLVLAHELDETRFWYAMPYHPGDHLGVVVRNAHGIGAEDGLRHAVLAEMLRYQIDLVATLARYHQDGLWHKDVKPDNIIVHDGAAHLVDFGLVTSLRSAMTLTTHGTEYFRDPEMVRMAMRGVKVHEVDGAKFDIYGAGAVLYFTLENTFPGHGGLSRFERPAPEALRWVVRRAMADYAQRYGSAAEMLADLRFVAEAADPWAVVPADLPSMRGESVELVDADGPVSTRVAAAAPPPRVSNPRGSSIPPREVGGRGTARPRITVTNWLTGGYVVGDASSGPGSVVGGSGSVRPATEQVVAARRRAGTRRANARRGATRVSAHRRTSTTLKLVAASGIACIVAFVIGLAMMEVDFSRSMDRVRSTFAGVSLGHEEAILREEIDQAVSELMDRGAIEVSYQVDDILRSAETVETVSAPPQPGGSSRLVVIDDRTSFAGTDADPDAILAPFKEAGWRIETDPQLAAQASVAMFKCRTWGAESGGGLGDRDVLAESFACPPLNSFRADSDVEAVLLMLTVDEEAGGHASRTRLVLIGDEAIEVAMRNAIYVDVEARWPDGRREIITVEVDGVRDDDGTMNPADSVDGDSVNDADGRGGSGWILDLNRESGRTVDVHTGPIHIRIAA